MSHDYFLVHRAEQLQRLCAATEGNRIELPERAARSSLPRQLGPLFKTMDKILKLSLDKPTQRGLVSKLTSLVSSAWRSKEGEEKETGVNLTAPQRDLLLDFECEIVKLRLDDDEQVAGFAGQIIQVVLADHENFFGLKPIPQYAESFAYELLFPTWLNLYTVMNTPAPDSSGKRPKPRLEESRQKIVLRFLQDWGKAKPDDEAEMIASLTFIVNRFGGTHAETLIQRLIDLAHDHRQRPTNDRLKPFWQVRQSMLEAEEVSDLTQDFLVVQTSLHPNHMESKYEVASEDVPRPELPPVVAALAKQADVNRFLDAQHWKVCRHVRAIIQGAAEFGPALTQLLAEQRDATRLLLEITGEPAAGRMGLAARSQELVAKIIQRELASGGKIESVRAFAAQVATRTDGFSKPTSLFLRQEFVDKSKNRRILLDCENSEKRAHISKQLMQGAKKASDDLKFLSFLALAAAFDPTIDAEQLEKTLRSIEVLQNSQAENSIGSNELGSLVADVRSGLPDTLYHLADPLRTAGATEGTLSRLYLALHEECELFRLTGRVRNFGVTRAGYTNLERYVDGAE